ncbi:MAG: deoxyhypusine synthase [Candidatus Moraniibacteriota bacterium]
MQKKDYLQKEVEHFDIKAIDARPIVDAMGGMSFSARDLARATEIYNRMLSDKDCTVVLAVAGSTSAAGCMQIYVDMVKNKMVDVVVATGATIVDMDFFEAIGFKHYQGSPEADNQELRSLLIDRIYDTLIDEEQVTACDKTIQLIANQTHPGVYSSREFIREMGKFLVTHSKKKDSLVQAAYENDVPIFCPAFSDSSAGYGLVWHQEENPEKHVSIDSVKDFRELTKLKVLSKETGILVVGGGTPKNFIQDSVTCANGLGKDVPMHKYGIQITVADVRDGACSSSTFKEAASWGKINLANEQMVYAEATSVLPLMLSHAYHTGFWKQREQKRLGKIFA